MADEKTKTLTNSISEIAQVLTNLNTQNKALLSDGTGTALLAYGLTLFTVAIAVRIVASFSPLNGHPLLNFSTFDFAILLLASLLLIGVGVAFRFYDHRMQFGSNQKLLDIALVREKAATDAAIEAAKKAVDEPYKPA